MAHKSVEDVLQGILGHTADGIDGLHFAVFRPNVPGAPANKPVFNEPALQTVLQLYGWESRTVEEQVEVWGQCTDAVRRSFQELADAAQNEKAKRRLRRLVMDVEVGGLLYAAVEDYGWVFAATLSQQSMNTGRAEWQLVEMVRELLRFLGPGSNSPPRGPRR
jgi:hypothetical protein